MVNMFPWLCRWTLSRRLPAVLGVAPHENGSKERSYTYCMPRRHFFGGKECGYNSDQIARRVAHEWAVYWATQRGPAERTPHRHQQHAQPVAPVRQRQGRRPLLTPMGFPDRAPPSHEGQPWGRTRVEKRHHYSRGPRDGSCTQPFPHSTRFSGKASTPSPFP